MIISVQVHYKWSRVRQPLYYKVYRLLSPLPRLLAYLLTTSANQASAVYGFLTIISGIPTARAILMIIHLFLTLLASALLLHVSLNSQITTPDPPILGFSSRKSRIYTMQIVYIDFSVIFFFQHSLLFLELKLI